MSKIIVIFTGILLLSGAAFHSAPAKAVAAQRIPQDESEATKEMRERMAREANAKRQQDIRDLITVCRVYFSGQRVGFPLSPSRDDQL